jgi:nitrilase
MEQNVAKVAIVQAGSLLYNTAGTIEKLRQLTAKAAKQGAKLVLFPGICCQYYNISEFLT